MAWECPICSFSENDDTSVKCVCGYEAADPTKPDYNKIGGALYLVLLGLSLNTFLYFINLYYRLGAIVSVGGAVLLLEIIYSVFFLLFPAALIYILFMRKRIFPKLMMIYYVFAICIVIDNYFAIRSMKDLPNYYDQLNNAINNAVVIPIACIAWMLYFKFSQRVRYTFVR
jgi:hypothetical protein